MRARTLVTKRTAGRVAALLVVAGMYPVAAGATSASANKPASTTTSFPCSGDAYGANINGHVIVDSGNLTSPCPSTTPSPDASLLSTQDAMIPYPPLKAEALSEDVSFMNQMDLVDSSAVGGGFYPQSAAGGDSAPVATVESDSDTAEVTLTGGGHTIQARVLNAISEAECSASGTDLEGSSELVGVTLDGMTIGAGATPNFTVPLVPSGQLVLNEQIPTQTVNQSGTSAFGDLVVNALHLTVPGSGGIDAIVAHADADITCPIPTTTGGGGGGQTCAPTHNFVTGGGFITGPSGSLGPDHANFGVGGGFNEKGKLFGHLEYLDHNSTTSGGIPPPNGNGPSPKVHGTQVTSYSCPTPDSRELQGSATVNGESGWCFKVDVTDADSTAGSDMFGIGIHRSAPDRSGNCPVGNGDYQVPQTALGGGHIEIHLGT